MINKTLKTVAVFGAGMIATPVAALAAVAYVKPVQKVVAKGFAALVTKALEEAVDPVARARYFKKAGN